MEDFISELLVVRPAFCGSAMHSLILKFTPKSNFHTTKEDEDDIPLLEQQVFTIAHRNLRKILEAFPM
jgi:hypothetical protein